VISRLIKGYVRLIEIAIIILMALLIVAVTLQICGRYIPFVPRYLWTEELSGFSLIWIIFLGATLGVKENKHFYADIFPDDLSRGFTKVLDFIYYFTLYVVSVVFVIFGWRFFKMGCIQKSNLSGLNLGFIYFSVFLSGISWLIFLTESLVAKLKSGVENR